MQATFSGALGSCASLQSRNCNLKSDATPPKTSLCAPTALASPPGPMAKVRPTLGSIHLIIIHRPVRCAHRRRAAAAGALGRRRHVRSNPALRWSSHLVAGSNPHAAAQPCASPAPYGPASSGCSSAATTPCSPCTTQPTCSSTPWSTWHPSRAPPSCAPPPPSPCTHCSCSPARRAAHRTCNFLPCGETSDTLSAERCRAIRCLGGSLHAALPALHGPLAGTCLPMASRIEWLSVMRTPRTSSPSS